MKITADTNLLVRLFVGDDSGQAQLASREILQADGVAIPLVVLCEFAWVLSAGYKISRIRLAEGLRALLDTSDVMLDRPAVEAGLAAMTAGADFADGVIAHEGRALGAEAFVSFDRRAVRALGSIGVVAREPGQTAS